jgi:HopJ type III effector protein
MTVQELLEQVRRQPDSIEFDQVIRVINEYYQFTPTAFKNGKIKNAVGTNEGSCRIFYFAQLQQLSEMETLALFGKYYRDDVLKNPSGADHGNIRNFILDGWLGIQFQGVALTARVFH